MLKALLTPQGGSFGRTLASCCTAAPIRPGCVAATLPKPRQPPATCSSHAVRCMLRSGIWTRFWSSTSRRDQNAAQLQQFDGCSVQSVNMPCCCQETQLLVLIFYSTCACVCGPKRRRRHLCRGFVMRLCSFINTTYCWSDLAP